MIHAPPQPVKGKGVREVDCPLYDECLTQAAKRKWKTWNCGQCANLELRAIRQRFNFIEPYYELLAEIYPEFRAKYGPVWGVVNRELSENRLTAINM